jgi:hypothetical protein
MASQSFAPQSVRERRLSLAEIDALVSARLGPTRGLGNSQPACFNRQIAMYLAARVGRWSTTIIGRFYGGRDHSTVCYGIQRIESLSESDPEVDALLTDLRRRLGENSGDRTVETRSAPFKAEQPELSDNEVERIAAAVAEKICQHFDTERKSGSHGILGARVEGNATL